MSTHYEQPCGHMGTDDAPCRCQRDGLRMEGPDVISTNMGVQEACWAKWQAGRRKYGEEFVGDPVQELYSEFIDALNYLSEIERQGKMTAGFDYIRLTTRRLAELVRTEARR